jgi:hypothetical protein
VVGIVVGVVKDIVTGTAGGIVDAVLDIIANIIEGIVFIVVGSVHIKALVNVLVSSDGITMIVVNSCKSIKVIASVIVPGFS